MPMTAVVAPITDPAEQEGETFRLYGHTNWAESRSAVLSTLFGHMVQRSEQIERYHGDLWHDATLLDANIDGPCTFWWGAYDCGTVISFAAPNMRGATPDAQLAWLLDQRKAVAYRVDLTCDSDDWEAAGTWSATFTLIEEAP